MTELTDETNGIYTQKTPELWGNHDGTKVIVHQFEGWNGCTAVNYVPNANCHPYNRWGYMSDIINPIESNVNIWSKTGSSSGITNECQGKFNNKLRQITKKI